MISNICYKGEKQLDMNWRKHWYVVVICILAHPIWDHKFIWCSTCVWREMSISYWVMLVCVYIYIYAHLILSCASIYIYISIYIKQLTQCVTAFSSLLPYTGMWWFPFWLSWVNLSNSKNLWREALNCEVAKNWFLSLVFYGSVGHSFI